MKRLVLRLPDGRSRPCDGCGVDVPVELAARVWMSTALGVCCAWTHPGVCEEQAVLLQREQPARRIEEPRSRQERLEERMATEAQAG